MVNKKLSVILESELNGRSFALSLPMGAPYQDCCDALLEFISEVKAMEKLDKESVALKKAQEEGQKEEAEPVSDL